MGERVCPICRAPVGDGANCRTCGAFVGMAAAPQVGPGGGAKRGPRSNLVYIGIGAVAVLVVALGAWRLGAFESSDPCKRALKRASASWVKWGAAGPSDGDKTRFLEECSAWPDDIKRCHAEAEDDAATGACTAKLVALETASGTSRSSRTRRGPCETAMRKMIDLGIKAGEKEPTDSDKKKFLEECRAWPDDVKNCFADAGDEAAVGACFAKVMAAEMEKAMKAAGEEARAAADEAQRAADEAAAEAALAVAEATAAARIAAELDSGSCSAVVTNMKRIGRAMGESDPSEEELRAFSEQCETWPDDARTCLAKAADTEGVSTCMQAIIQAQMKAALEEAQRGAP
ncbi:MAG: hypothetical protein AMXMBFR64_23810 [Myxococcales bacterium]